MSNYRNKMMISKDADEDIIRHLRDVIAQTQESNPKVAMRALEYLTRKLKENDEEKDR